jgi:hypothetical protein
VTEAIVEDFFAVAAPETEPPSASAVEDGFGATSPKLAEKSPASEGGLDDSDSLAVMERELRELEQQRAVDERRARMELGQRRRDAMVFALETWLSAIVADREQPGA